MLMALLKMIKSGVPTLLLIIFRRGTMKVDLLRGGSHQPIIRSRIQFPDLHQPLRVK